MAGGISIYSKILIFIAPMFKPTINNFHAARGNHMTNFGNFVRPESAVKSNGQIIQPNLTLTPAFKDMNTHSLDQIITVKTDAVTVLNENRWHGRSYFNFFTSTLEFRPLCSYFSRRMDGKSSGEPSAKPPLDWK